MIERTGTDKEFLELVDKTVRWIMIFNPLVGLSLAGNVIRIREDLRAATDWACTDKWEIIYNPILARKAMAAIGFDHTDTSLCHEWVHLMDNHIRRRGTREPDTWNQATDMHAVHQGALLATPPRKPMRPYPTDGVIPAEWSHNLTSEQIYDRIKQEPNKLSCKCVPHQLHVPDAEPTPAGGMTSTDLQFQAEMQKIVTIVSLNPNGRHYIQKSAWLHDRIVKIVRGRVPWGQLLRGGITDGLGYDTPSYSPPNRKYLSWAIMPSLKETKKRKLMIAVDVSGSVDAELLALFRSNVTPAARRASEIRVVTFDNQIRETHTTRRWQDLDRLLRLKTGAHSHTSVAAVFAEAFKYRPDVLVIHTDGFVSGLPDKPLRQTLWVTPEQAPKLPWGRQYRMEHAW